MDMRIMWHKPDKRIKDPREAEYKRRMAYYQWELQRVQEQHSDRVWTHLWESRMAALTARYLSGEEL